MRLFKGSEEIHKLREEVEELRTEVSRLKSAANIYLPYKTFSPFYREPRKISAAAAICLLAEKAGVGFDVQEAQNTPERPILVLAKEKAK